jgi:hypothetical protein
VFAFSSEAQVRLNFPRLLSAQELTTTGLAFVNTSNSSVAADLSFYGSNGALLGKSPLSVPAKGQVAKLASEVLPNVTTSTWIQVSSSSSELQGFEVVGDFARLVDIAGPASESTQLAVIRFSKEDVISIANPGSQAATAQLTLNAVNGSVLTTKSVPLASFQAASFRLGDLSNDDNIALVSITSNVAVSASLTTRVAGGDDIGVTNAAPSANAPTTFFFPFTPSGPQGTSNWKTFLGIANVASTSQTVSITLNPDGGSPVTIQRNLSSGASVGDTVANLFSLSANAFTGGWIRVSGTAGLAGVAAYQDSANGPFATVPSQSSGSTRFLFGHIAVLSGWYTGIALLNNTTTAATVEVYAIDSNGQLIGAAASFSLPANSRRTFLISDLVPDLLQRATDGGWVFVRTTNNVPILGFELFGHGIFPILANVQGFTLPSTSFFTPPAGGTLPSRVTIDRVSFTDVLGNSATRFQPLDPIVYVASITNPSGAKVSGEFSFTVADPRNQFLLSAKIPVSLTPGAVDLGYLGFIPSNALTGSYLVTAGLAIGGQVVTQTAFFEVSGGSNTPSVGFDAFSTSPSGTFQIAFRPGETVRFILQTANFTAQSASAAINYTLTGPGGLKAASGTLTFTMPAGISAQTVDIAIPSNAPQGLFALSSALTVSGSTSTKSSAISVVPKSTVEAITVENAFVADSAGVPRGGFTAGSNIILSMARHSTFPASTPATIRYTVTAPDGSSVFDQPLAINVSSGISTGSIPFTLSSTAPPGNYTFQATITYADNGGSTRTPALNTTFTVGATPPVLKETITAIRPNVRDYNLVTRTSYSPGEPIVFYRAVYSTFTTPVSGTVRYLVKDPLAVTVLDSTVNTTFSPGMNVSGIVVTTSQNIGQGTYTLAIEATAQGLSSNNSTTFGILGGAAPPLSVVVQPDDKNAIFANYISNEFPATTPGTFVNDGFEAIENARNGIRRSQ